MGGNGGSGDGSEGAGEGSDQPQGEAFVQADHGGTLYRRMLDKSTDTEEDAMQVQLRGDTLVFEARITGRELHDDHVVRKLAGHVHGWAFVPGEFRVVQ